MPDTGGRLMRMALGMKDWFADPEYPSHPPNEPPTWGERITKRALGLLSDRSSLLEEDEPYLEQYFHPDRDVLPKQPLRPTQATVPPGYEVRHAARNKIPLNPSNTGPLRMGEAYNLAGLGTFKRSGNKEYDSAYDLWDFDTDSGLLQATRGQFPMIDRFTDRLAKKAMGYVGSPYAVYERFPTSPTAPERQRRK